MNENKLVAALATDNVHNICSTLFMHYTQRCMSNGDTFYCKSNYKSFI